MPFQSEKQRKYLWANEPEIARDWTDKYGSRVKKDNGGIMDSLSQSYGNVVGPHIQALYGPYGIAKTAPSSYDYHVLGTGDLTQRISDELKATGNPLSSAAFDYAAPGLAGALSIPYDALQAGIRTLYDKDWNFRGPLEGFDITDTMNPNYKSVPGFGTRWAQEKPLEAMIGRFTGAAQPLVNRWDKTGASLAKAWDAIKNEFGGSAEAADLSGMVQRRPQAGQRRSGIPRRDTWNVKRRLEGDENWMGGPLMGYGQYGMPDLNKMYRLAMNEKMRSYGEHETIPNEKYEGLEIQRNYIPTGELPLHIRPYKKHSGSASTEPIYKTVGFNQDGSRFMTKEEYDNLNLDTNKFGKTIGPLADEEEEQYYTTGERIPRPNKWQQFLSKYTRQPFRPATSYTGGYTPAQLNMMNALGGWYSAPARAQRQNARGIATVLARKRAAEAGRGTWTTASQALLNKKTMGSRPGYYDTPGGGQTTRAGRSGRGSGLSTGYGSSGTKSYSEQVGRR